MKKSVLLLSILLIVGSLGWSLRHPLLYQYYIWRIERSNEGPERIEYNEKIQALWDKAGSWCFISTYKDTTKPVCVRRAAAKALIKSDPALAEGLFRKYINSANPDVSGMAIRNLGTIKSRTFKDEILQQRHSTNELVRWCVVDYLANFQDAESMGILKSIRDSDTSEFVRNAAAVRLKHLSKKSGN